MCTLANCFLASARRWLRLWSPAFLISRPSARGRTSQPGSGSCRSSARAAERQARQHQQARRSLYARSIHRRALTVIRHAKIHGTKHRPWLTATAGHDGQARALRISICKGPAPRRCRRTDLNARARTLKLVGVGTLKRIQNANQVSNAT
jgi:hypothetical protein